MASNRTNNLLSRSGRRLKRWHYVVGSIVLVLLLAVSLFLVFLVQSIKVASDSMSRPTFSQGDRLLVRRSGGEPGRGDIVTFHHPQAGEMLVVKRVVGLPGERIVIKDNIIIVYNEQYPSGFTPKFDFERFLQDFPPDEPAVDRLIGSGEVFILGDNRQSGGSLDSRHASFGNLPIDNIEGVVVFILVNSDPSLDPIT